MLAAVNGTHLYHEEAGAGPAVILIHGFTLDTRMWDDQFPALAQRHRVICYDLRGFGRSAPPDGPYSHVEDLRALLDHRGIERASLVGLSKGGGVALDFALTYPERVTALALLDSILGGHPWSAEASARNGLVWQEAARDGIAAAKASWLAHPLFAPAMRWPAVAARLNAIIDDYSGWHFVNPNPEQGISPPAAERLHALSLPTLALVGEHDLPDFQAIAERIGREAPRASTLVVPDAGHMTSMEAPAAVNRALLAFLEEHAGS